MSEISWLFLILGLLLILGLFDLSESKATLTNNGYEDFVVAISPDVPQEIYTFIIYVTTFIIHQDIS